MWRQPHQPTRFGNECFALRSVYRYLASRRVRPRLCARAVTSDSFWFVYRIFSFFVVCTCTDLQASVPTRWRARVTRACRPRRPFDCSDVRGGLRREKHHTAASIGPAPFASAPAAAAAAAGKPADCPFWGVRAASPGAQCRVLCRTSARKTALCAAACRDCWG